MSSEYVAIFLLLGLRMIDQNRENDKCRKREIRVCAQSDECADIRYDKLFEWNMFVEIFFRLSRKTRTWTRTYKVQLHNKCSTYQPREEPQSHEWNNVQTAKGYIYVSLALVLHLVYTFQHKDSSSHQQRADNEKWASGCRSSVCRTPHVYCVSITWLFTSKIRRVI